MSRALALLLAAAACGSIAAASPPEPGETKAQTELGKRLFFDPRLSADKTISCATCHDPRKGWSDGKPVSVGIHGLKGKRNAPTILNTFGFEALFWDGRAATLEEQAVKPIVTREEMGFSAEGAERAIADVPGYKPFFAAAFGGEVVTIDRIARALAVFERSLRSMDSPYDRYNNGDQKALTPEAKRGMLLVQGSASCSACHSGPTFSDSRFHNLGVGIEKAPPDLGRFEISKRDRDRGGYRTPTLRNLKNTAPYMHDGSMKTLREVIDFYDKGGVENAWLDPDVQPLKLTEQNKTDILAFLEALNGDPLVLTPPAPLPDAPVQASVQTRMR